MIDLPARLSIRPMDIHRKIPVPWVNEFTRDDGSLFSNFTAVNGTRCLRSAQDKLCGLCAEPLDYWIAFLGGPKSYQHRTYSDPPMHESCADVAIKLCPHIALQRHKRAPEDRTTEIDVVTPDGWSVGKPEVWIMGLTRNYTWSVDKNAVVIFSTAPFRRIRTFLYNDKGEIHES